MIDPRPCGGCGGRVVVTTCTCLDCGAKLIRPQPGPQTDFLATDVDFALYGGAAGGGKSWALLADALRHGIDTPGWVGVIFRARGVDIDGEDSIYADAKRLYDGTGARFRDGNKRDCRWPGGGVLLFRHLSRENIDFYLGKAYAWIGFEEATQIPIEHQIALAGRARSVCGARPVVRGTTNPNPDHDLARWVDPFLHRDPAYPRYGTADRTKSGMVRYWARSVTTDRIEFAATREAAAALTGQALTDVKTFAFFPALLEDNVILETIDPGYRASINAHNAVKRAQLGGGNWYVRANTGGMLARWRWGTPTRIVTEPLAPIVRRVRAWDFASTEPSAVSPDPDYTAGVAAEFDVDGRCYFSGLFACRRATPDRDRLVAAVVAADGPHWTQRIPIDPAAGGVDAAYHQRKNMVTAGAGEVVALPVRGAKVVRGQPLADALELGIEIDGKTEPAIYILDRDGWMGRPYLDAAESAPATLGDLLWRHLDGFGTEADEHDDVGDAASDAYAYGAGKLSGSRRRARVKPQRRARQ